MNHLFRAHTKNSLGFLRRSNAQRVVLSAWLGSAMVFAPVAFVLFIAVRALCISPSPRDIFPAYLFGSLALIYGFVELFSLLKQRRSGVLFVAATLFLPIIVAVGNYHTNDSFEEKVVCIGVAIYSALAGLLHLRWWQVLRRAQATVQETRNEG